MILRLRARRPPAFFWSRLRSRSSCFRRRERERERDGRRPPCSSLALSTFLVAIACPPSAPAAAPASIVSLLLPAALPAKPPANAPATVAPRFFVRKSMSSNLSRMSDIRDLSRRELRESTDLALCRCSRRSCLVLLRRLGEWRSSYVAMRWSELRGL